MNLLIKVTIKGSKEDEESLDELVNYIDRTIVLWAKDNNVGFCWDFDKEEKEE